MVKYRLLVIDDMPEVRKSVRSIFCPQPTAAELFRKMMNGEEHDPKENISPYEVSEASQGEEGVSIFRGNQQANTPFDLILVDMVMPPGIDGRETIRRIREYDTNIPIIVFTSFHEFKDEHLRECNKGGRKPMIIYKPITDGQVLIHAVIEELASVHSEKIEGQNAD